MIITRTPFRITFGGGGTDLSSFYKKHGGFIFSAAIDKYVYISVNRPFVDDLVRVKYSQSETTDTIHKIKHELARECCKLMGIENAIEIVSMADIPAGTGLGSSSSYTVGLLHALHTMKKSYISSKELAEQACQIEIDFLGKPIGKQDQYIATFGGLTVLEIDKNGEVDVKSPDVSPDIIEDFENNILIQSNEDKSYRIIIDKDIVSGLTDVFENNIFYNDPDAEKEYSIYIHQLTQETVIRAFKKFWRKLNTPL